MSSEIISRLETGLQPTYEELKRQKRNYFALPRFSLQPTYEELKPVRHGEKISSCQVCSLPIFSGEEGGFFFMSSFMFSSINSSNSSANHSPRPEKEEEVEEVRTLKEEMLTTGRNPVFLWRMQHNLSRVELAAICEVSIGVIEKLEAGYYKTISERLLLTLHGKAGMPWEIAALYILWRSHLAEKAKQKMGS